MGLFFFSYFLVLVFLAFYFISRCNSLQTCDIRLVFWIAEQAQHDWLLLYLNSHVLFLNVYGFEDLALLFFYFIELSIS